MPTRSSRPEPRHLELTACTVDLLTGALSGGREGRLTERERALLAYLAARPGQVVERSELAEQVFGYRPTVRTRAVDKSMYTLRRKVERDGATPDHLLSRHGQGYVFVRSDPDLDPDPEPVDRPPQPVAGVPRAWTAFVGRARELELLARAVEEHRLVSVVGPGGVGKTRLVQQLLTAAQGGDEPARFCDLSDARTAEGITYALARALGVTLVGDPVSEVGDALRQCGRCLVVLDNVEQITDPLRPMLAGWLASSEVRLLLTTRETIGLPGEHLLVLDPLPDDDARRLYLERAEASCPGFTLSDADRDALPDVIRLLDGLPLAIELAAARSPVFSPSRLLGRLSERFGLLRRRRGLVERHASLRATLDWSWDLLTPAERRAAAQLSVFEGGFTLAAAEAVLDVEPVVELVQQLWEKSWIRRQGADRFGLLLTLHDYLRDQLDDPGAIQRRHATWCGQLQDADDDLDNVIAACRRAIGRGWPDLAVRTLNVAWTVFTRHGARGVWLDLAQRVLDLPDLPPTDARAVALGAGSCALWLGHVEEAEALARRGLEPDASDRGSVKLWILLARLQAMQGRPDEAEDSLRTALGSWQETGGPDDAGLLHQLANATAQMGLHQTSGPLYRRALEIARAHDQQLHVASILQNLGVLEARSGRLHEAEEHFVNALPVFQRLGELAREATLLSNLADLQNCVGAPVRARANAERSVELFEQMGSPAGWGLARVALGCALTQLDDPVGAEHQLQTALDEARQAGDLISAAFALDALGDVWCHVGDHDAAAASYREALDVLENQSHLRVGPLVQLGAATALAGRFDEAEDALVEALRSVEERGDQGLVAEANAWLAIVAWQTGRPDEARDRLALAEAPGPLPHVRVQRALARAYEVMAVRPRLVDSSG